MLLKISARPKMPQMMTMKSTPPSSWGTPKANRGTPHTTSSPIVAMNSPISVEMMVLMGSSPPKTVSSPKDMSAKPKYSAGPKRRANLASAGAKHIRIATEIVPAIQEPMAATEKAAPARPLRAI